MKKVVKNKQLRREHAHYGVSWENSTREVLFEVIICN